MFETERVIYLTTDDVPAKPASAIESYVQSQFQTIAPDELSESGTIKSEDLFLIINYQALTGSQAQSEPLIFTARSFRTIIINAPETIPTSRLITLGYLTGYFLTCENTATFMAGMAAILEGEYCLPDSISAQLLRYYQSVVLRHTEPMFTNLTQREIEVLQSLKEGVSNNKLADQLFVSEHTVKSHLYKIFKKLRVKNRNQAIEWAHKFLP